MSFLFAKAEKLIENYPNLLESSYCVVVVSTTRNSRKRNFIMNDQNENAYEEEGSTEQTGVSRNTLYIALAVVAAVVVIGILIAVMFSGSEDSSESKFDNSGSEESEREPRPPVVEKDDNVTPGDEKHTSTGIVSKKTSDNIDEEYTPDTTRTGKKPYWERSPEARGINKKGRFVLQLASYLSYDDADNAWKKLQSATPSRYQDIEKIIERADLGRRGVFYRLRVGAFDTMQAAEDYCDALERQRSDCWITNR